MNLLKAQDTKLKLTSINPLLIVEVESMESIGLSNQFQVAIKPAMICSTNLPAFINYAKGCDYIIEKDPESNLVNFVIY